MLNRLYDSWFGPAYSSPLIVNLDKNHQRQVKMILTLFEKEKKEVI